VRLSSDCLIYPLLMGRGDRLKKGGTEARSVGWVGPIGCGLDETYQRPTPRDEVTGAKSLCSYGRLSAIRRSLNATSAPTPTVSVPPPDANPRVLAAVLKVIPALALMPGSLHSRIVPLRGGQTSLAVENKNP